MPPLFYPLQIDVNLDKCEMFPGEDLNLYHTIQTFKRPWKRRLLKTLWEKEKMLETSIFSFSPNVFYLSQNRFQILSHIYFVVCKCFEFGPV